MGYKEAPAPSDDDAGTLDRIMGLSLCRDRISHISRVTQTQELALIRDRLEHNYGIVW